MENVTIRKILLQILNDEVEGDQVGVAPTGEGLLRAVRASRARRVSKESQEMGRRKGEKKSLGPKKKVLLPRKRPRETAFFCVTASSPSSAALGFQTASRAPKLRVSSSRSIVDSYRAFCWAPATSGKQKNRFRA